MEEDGQTLKTWLKSNQHVRTITGDRASAYAKAIEEELPDAIQAADRFHLHQNLLKEGCSVSEIVRRMGVSRSTVMKYREGSPDVLCRKLHKGGILHQYRNISLKTYRMNIHNLRSYVSCSIYMVIPNQEHLPIDTSDNS